MNRSLKALTIGVACGLLLCIALTIIGVSYWPMLIISEGVLVGVFSLFYWKPTAIRDGLRKFVERVRIWA